jgi:ferredoxin
MDFLDIKKYLLSSGATVVGFGHVVEALGQEIAHLDRAVAIGIDRNLNETTVEMLHNLQVKVARRLKKSGYRYLIIPPDSDRRDGTYISKLYDLFSHKVAATCSGLGWVGRNGLLINKQYGPRLCYATVLTNAPLEADSSIDSCLCGECTLCVDHCPAGAINGGQWSRETPFPMLIDHEKCRGHKESTKSSKQKPNCGLCVNICPYGRKKPMELKSEINDLEEDRCLSIK